MSEVCKKRPASLVLASPSPLKSTAPSERGFDSSGYGVTEASGLFPAWSGLDLYALACDACASIIDPMDIHVQLDVALASLGEYHWRLNHKELTSETTRQKQKLYAARVGRSVDQVIFDEHSVSYVKLSSDINAALTQQGVLFEGKGNPYLSMLHPHRCNIIDHGFNDDFEGDCSLHNDCFGGMLTQRALKRRVEIYRSDGLSMNEIALRKALVIVEYAVQLCEILVAAHRPSLIVLDGRVVNDRDSEMGPDGLLISANLPRGVCVNASKASPPRLKLTDLVTSHLLQLNPVEMRQLSQVREYGRRDVDSRLRLEPDGRLPSAIDSHTRTVIH